MRIELGVTSIRRIFRALSVYAEKNRAADPTVTVKWETKESLRIFGYDRPEAQVRLCEIRLDKSHCSDLGRNHPDFSTDIPNITGLVTAFDRKNTLITTKPEVDYLTIQDGSLNYNIEKVTGAPEMELRRHYLPIEKKTISGSIPLRKLWAFSKTAPAGPIKLRIRDGTVKLFSSGDTDKCRLDVTCDVSIHPEGEIPEYTYDLGLLRHIMERLPIYGQIELIVNEDLLKLRYELDDNIGYINYYQRSKQHRKAAAF